MKAGYGRLRGCKPGDDQQATGNNQANAPMNEKRARPHHDHRQQDAALTAEQWRALIERSALEFTVTSNSMYPTFASGDKIIIEPLTARPQPGDVVVYCSGRLVAHRYLGNGICRGDRYLREDLPVGSHQVVGIAARVVRNGRTRVLSKHMPLKTRMYRGVLRCYAALRRCFPKTAAHGTEE